MTNALAEAPKKQLTIRQRLTDPQMLAEFGKAMPAHCKPDRMARVAMTAITRTPKLAECDQASFFQAMLSLSQWGLEPDGRRAHLIPFENRKRGVIECQLIIDYKGLVELAYRSGIVKNIHADVVREGDIFEYNMGHVIKHVPHFLRRDQDRPKDAGYIYAIYCLVELKGETSKCEVLSVAEVEGIQKRSRAANSGPWVTDWNEMAKKTAFRRVSKWLPLSAEIADAFEGDDDRSDPIEQQPVAPRTFSDLAKELNVAPPVVFDSTMEPNNDHQPEQGEQHNDAPLPGEIPGGNGEIVNPLAGVQVQLDGCETLKEINAIFADVWERHPNLSVEDENLLTEIVNVAKERVRSKRGPNSNAK